MPSFKRTSKGLNQYIGSENPRRIDYNSDMSIIDDEIVRLEKLIEEISVEINVCPHAIGDIYITSNTIHPGIKWPGTNWRKIEGRMLIGSNNKFPLNSTGGKSELTLDTAWMPRHRHTVDAHKHKGYRHRHKNDDHDHDMEHDHKLPSDMASDAGVGGIDSRTGPSAYRSVSKKSDRKMTGKAAPYTDYQEGMTGEATPDTDYQGDGKAFSIMNPYLAVNIWQRVSVGGNTDIGGSTPGEEDEIATDQDIAFLATPLDIPKGDGIATEQNIYDIFKIKGGTI